MLTEYSPRGCTPYCRIFFFLICFIWLFMLFQDQTYMMGVYVPSYGVRLSSPKVANLPRFQIMAPTASCQAPKQMSLSTTPAVDWVWWAGLVPCSEAAAKQCASWGTVRCLSTKGREVHDWIVSCCKCDFPYVSELSVSPPQTGCLKNRTDSQIMSVPGSPKSAYSSHRMEQETKEMFWLWMLIMCCDFFLLLFFYF